MNENSGAEEGEGLVDPNPLSVPDDATVRSANSPPANSGTEPASTAAMLSSAGPIPKEYGAEQSQEDTPGNGAGIERVHDDAGPHPPAAMLKGSLEKSDIVKQITLKNGPQIMDENAGPDLSLSVEVDPPQDASMVKKIAQSQLESSTDPSPPVPFHGAEYEDHQARMDAIMFKSESIAICKSLSSGAWFVRESSKASAFLRGRALRRGGRWRPVALRENVEERWPRLRNFDFYLIPSNEGGALGVEYVNGEDAVDEDEDSPRGGTGIFIDEEAGDGNAGWPLLDQAGNDSTPVIPEAFLVEDDNDNIGIVVGEPLLPWWKQTRIVLSVICLMLVAAAIAFAIMIPVSSLASKPVEGTFLAPSASPTTCFQVEIAVESFNPDHPTRQEWELSRIHSVNDVDEVISYEGSDGDFSHSESLCLPKGRYEFSLRFETQRQEGGGGACCAGRYSVTSDGEAIVRGDELWQEYLGVTSRFTLPHVSGSRSSSRAPAIVASPSQQPSTAPS